ncbi:MAG TPA: hypothetical protein PLK02_07850 [Paludibacteraceae bacterium]|nr:hypothetical protein [Paludibacteraceae bacterium]
MAYSPCVSAVAKNIVKNCSSPIVGGYTGRGVLVPLDKAPTFTVSAQNPRTIVQIEVVDKFIAIDNVFTDPFAGTTKASNGDSGSIKHTKTFTFRIPQRGSDVSRDIVEALIASPLGFVAVLEKKDRVGNGSFEVIGYQDALKVTADGVTQDETANDGATTVTMSCSEHYFEVDLFDTSYVLTLAAFETMLGNTLP